MENMESGGIVLCPYLAKQLVMKDQINGDFTAHEDEHLIGCIL
jgi:hypothetical protein